ncbi:MAG TPA: UDP-N-acetylmuramate--L-alanine ligase [Anaerolineales bacterium]|nr:UDP-N-acetylmuramate--L-alanine ligase [Anaerolineales bacterium]
MTPEHDHRKEHVHFIGIGGSGLSAIARMLKESGYSVTGSDMTFSPFAADLQAAGVTVLLGHAAENIRGADWVVRSSAIGEENVEVLAARAAGIPVFRRADFLGKFMQDKQGIAVAGTHGKTTTTAMIAFVLSELGLDPSFIVGGMLSNYGVNARAGRGSAFVVEADEYDRMFLGLKPQIEVITSLEHDHPDMFPTFEDMLTAFDSFVSLLPHQGTLIGGFDDPAVAALLAKTRRVGRQVMAYSLRQESTIVAPRWMQGRNLQPNRLGGFDFDAATNVGSTKLISLGLQVPGEHNVSNALAALSVCAVMGLSVKDAAEALGRFAGTGRRFEVKGERGGVIVIDDYAHHPTEIRATLSAARRRYPSRRIWAVWQPHTYSRTQTLFDAFVTAFEDADETIVTEIYRSREPRQDYSSEQVVKAMNHPSRRFVPTLEATTEYLLQHVQPNDVVLVLSAGDADQISANLLARLGSEVKHG